MSTNYYSTLITVAPDTRADHGTEPPAAKPTVASQQFAMISAEPYAHTSDDVIFARVAEQNGIAAEDVATAQEAYFATGRACLRTSPLAKTYGWGIHANADGKIALIAMETPEYTELLNDDTVKKIPAMKSKRN